MRSDLDKRLLQVEDATRVAMLMREFGASRTDALEALAEAKRVAALGLTPDESNALVASDYEISEATVRTLRDEVRTTLAAL